MSRPSRSPALTALSLMASLIVPALAPNGRVAGPAVGAAAQDPAAPAKRAPDVAGLRELVELELYGEVLAAESTLRTLPPDAPDREQALALLARAVFETRGPEAALAEWRHALDAQQVAAGAWIGVACVEHEGCSRAVRFD